MLYITADIDGRHAIFPIGPFHGENVKVLFARQGVEESVVEKCAAKLSNLEYDAWLSITLLYQLLVGEFKSDRFSQDELDDFLFQFSEDFGALFNKSCFLGLIMKNAIQIFYDETEETIEYLLC